MNPEKCPNNSANVGVKQQLRNLFAARGWRPQKQFGQNFLLDNNLLNFIAAHATANDCVLEIGPGTGRLTELMLASGAEIIAVEIDRGLCGLLREKFAARANFTLIESDILDRKNAINSETLAVVSQKFAAKKNGELKCIANLPYAAGTPFIANLCGDLLPWRFAVVLVQYEVAQRILAAPGSAAYGGLTVKIANAGAVKILRKAPPAFFYPEPEVDSALIKIDFFACAQRAKIAWRQFDLFLKILFMARRKTLRKTLRQKFAIEKIIRALTAENLTGDERAENLSPEKLYALAQHFFAEPGNLDQ